MTEIESAFTFLHDNIPSWLANLNEIAEKVTAMQSEMTKVSISVAPPMKKKTGSMESIRDAKMDIILEEPSSSTLVQQSSLTPGRKRKTASVLSGRASGPSKYRSRTMVVIQYDGTIQKSLETLVRNIGTGRNMLRKGKMVAKMQALADMAGSDDDDNNDDDDDADPVLSKISYRHRARISSVRVARVRTTTRGSRSTTGTTPPEVFDSTDKTLEQAQSLCEKAAHQSLREGNCSKELDGVGKYLKEVLEKSGKEAAKYKTTHEQSLADPESGSTSSMDIVIDPDPKPSQSTTPVHSVPFQTPPAPKTMDIEVDDGDDDDEDFVMPPVRLMSRSRG